MKKYILLICIGLLGVSYSKSASNCENKLLVKMLQDLIDNSNLIKPWTRDILERIGDCTIDDTAIVSLLDVIESLVENISVSTSDELVRSQLDIIESTVDGTSACCNSNGSQLDVIESLVENISVSTSDELVRSQLDIIESTVDGISACCNSNDSQLDVIESLVENITVSTSDVIGELTDIGSCLDSAIDVPDDINNLTLTVIALLKTILLDLRGCNIP